MQFACILRTIAHRTGAIKSSQHTWLHPALLRFAVNLHLAEGDCAENMQPMGAAARSAFSRIADQRSDHLSDAVSLAALV